MSLTDLQAGLFLGFAGGFMVGGFFVMFLTWRTWWRK